MRPTTEWTFGYKEIAKATGRSCNTAMRHRLRGYWAPDDIASLAIYLARYGSEALRRKIVEALIWRQIPNDPGGWQAKREKRAKARG